MSWQLCRICYFYEPGEHSREGEGHCKRYPPVYLPNVATMDAIEPFDDLEDEPYERAAVVAKYATSFGFPAVHDNEWCGEFRPESIDG